MVVKLPLLIISGKDNMEKVIIFLGLLIILKVLSR